MTYVIWVVLKERQKGNIHDHEIVCAFRDEDLAKLFCDEENRDGRKNYHFYQETEVK